MTVRLDHPALMQPTLALGDLRALAAQIHALSALAEDIRRHNGPPSDGGGFTVLFAGESGTGKTLAAEALAHELSSALLLVDVAEVVSKFIGETEKNLRRLFHAAEGGGALVFFDEADALFGRRTANIEVNYFLDHAERATVVSVFSVAGPPSLLDPELRGRLGASLDFGEAAPH